MIERNDYTTITNQIIALTGKAYSVDEVIAFLTFVKDYASMYLKQAKALKKLSK